MDKGIDGRGHYRAIYTSLWDDPDFRSLTPHEKLIFLNLRTSPLTNMPVIYPYYLEAIEKQTGLSRKAIVKGIDTLCHTHWIAIEEGVVWVKKGLKYDPNIILTNPKHLTAIKTAILALPKLKIVKDFLELYQIDIPYDIPNGKGYQIGNGIGYANQDTDKETEKEIDIAIQDRVSDFGKFNKAYPKKVKMKAALEEWKKSKTLPPIEIIVTAIKFQIRHKEKLKSENKFVADWPDPERWIKGERWNDEVGDEVREENQGPPARYKDEKTGQIFQIDKKGEWKPLEQL